MLKVLPLSQKINRLLGTGPLGDPSRNGLQVGGDWPVQKVGLAVDANAPTFRAAIAAKCQFLIVHHGLIWKEPLRIVDHQFDRISLLVENQLALYATHLPLDLHPRFGNNAVLLRMLGLRPQQTFGEYAGQTIGFLASFSKRVELRTVQNMLAKKLGSAGKLFAFGSPQVRTVAVISGGAGSLIEEAVQKKVDLFITGEIGHSQYSTIEDAGLNVLALGHYLSETVGLHALEKHLASKYQLKTCFIDHPTGL